jgi:hypothetical protein
MLASRSLLISLGLLVVAFAAPSFAANHYIRSGNGNGSGSDWTNTCNDFTGSCAVSALVRGDTYYVAAGTYAGVNFNTAASGNTLITIKKATVADHGTTTGWNDIFANGPAAFSDQVNFGTSNWLMDGQTGGGPGSLTTWTTGFGFSVSVTGTSPALRTDAVNNVTVRHIQITGNLNSNGGGSIAQDGVALYGATNFTLSYYYINNVGRCVFFLSTQNFVAEYGYTGVFVSTSATHAELASIWGFTIPSNGIIFRYNAFTHSEGTGGLIFDNHEQPTGAGMKVYGNVFYKPANDPRSWEINNGLIGGWTGGNGEQYHNVSIYNNTFIHTTSADGNSPIGNFPNTASGNVAFNNLFYDTNSVSYGDYASGTNSVVNADPTVNAAGGNFQLKADTTTGTTLSSPYNLDPLGIMRGTDGVWDLGAYQFGSSVGSNPTPPTALVAVVQ